MRLDELFDTGATLQDQLQQAVQDMLIPLIAMKAPFVTVQQVIERLRDENTGLAVDRATVMQMLDPAKLPAIKSIEGDKVYLQPPGEEDDDENKEGEDQKARDAEKIEATGTKQAQKMAREQPPAPPPPAAPPAPPAPPQPAS